jgi:hypothetical protein
VREDHPSTYYETRSRSRRKDMEDCRATEQKENTIVSRKNWLKIELKYHRTERTNGEAVILRI